MVKELVIAIYLAAFRVVFCFFKLWPMKKNKVVFVVSFGLNSLYVNSEIARRKTAAFETVFLYKTSASYDFSQMEDIRAIRFETANIVHMLACIYHLATARYVLIDNYYGFLAVTNFREEAECIQLWHAAGALKTFGWADHAAQQRSPKSRSRFLRVYETFDKVVVGSEVMAQIFTKAFRLSSDNILRSGVPRTDFFYDTFLQAKVEADFRNQHPELAGKKVILYAPTFRDGELNDFNMALDLSQLHQSLGKAYVVFLRLHPAIHHKVNNTDEFPGFVYDYSAYPEINSLLVISDYLITDYSSIPYEYALLNKPMLFFAPDLETYQAVRGLWEDYASSVPGPVARTTTEVVQAIQMNAFDLDLVKAFARKWNQYSNGNSSKHVVDYLCDEEENEAEFLKS